MKTCHSILTVAAMLGLAATAMATPTIGVYFDTEGDNANLFGEPQVFYDAYVLINNADMMVGGAAFALDSEGGFTILGQSWREGVVFGDLLTGVEIGFYDPLVQFGDNPQSIGHFTVVAMAPVLNSHQTVVADPDYATPVLADMFGIKYEAVGETSSITMTPMPEIGLFFDNDGTQLTLTENGGMSEIHEAWIMVRNAEMFVAGASFRLVMDPRIMILTATPADGFTFGSLTAGVDIGLFNYLPVFGSSAGLLYTLNLTTFNNVMLNAELQIVNHPSYDAPKVADINAVKWTAEGLTSYMTIPVGTEEMSWGQVKSLY